MIFKNYIICDNGDNGFKNVEESANTLSKQILEKKR